MVPLSRWLGGAGKPLLLGSLWALLLAYPVRFMAVAYGPLESSLERIRPSLPEASRSLGVGGVGLFFKVYLPLLVPGALSAALLVFVDVLKEMPATLLMRPFGWDTLAVRVFEMTSEGEWARASLPALTLVLVGLLPVIGLIRRSARRPGIVTEGARLRPCGYNARHSLRRVLNKIRRRINVADRRCLATPGRRNPWDSVRLCMTCTWRSAPRWSISVVGTCPCTTVRKSRSTTGAQ